MKKLNEKAVIAASILLTAVSVFSSVNIIIGLVISFSHDSSEFLLFYNDISQFILCLTSFITSLFAIISDLFVFGKFKKVFSITIICVNAASVIIALAALLI